MGHGKPPLVFWSASPRFWRGPRLWEHHSAGTPKYTRMSSPGKVKGVDAVLDGLALVRKAQFHHHAAVQVDIRVAHLFDPGTDALLGGGVRVNADGAAVTERCPVHLAGVNILHRFGHRDTSNPPVERSRHPPGIAVWLLSTSYGVDNPENDSGQAIYA